MIPFYIINISNISNIIKCTNNEIQIELKRFTPKNIPGLAKHNDLQRYGFIHLNNEIDIKSFHVNVLNQYYALTDEEKKILKSTEPLKEGEKTCQKFLIPYKHKTTPFKIERNDSELTLEYYINSVNDLDLESTQKQSVLSYLENSGKGTFIVISIEWFNFFNRMMVPMLFRINITDTSDQHYRSGYFSVANSLEIDIDLLERFKILEGGYEAFRDHTTNDIKNIANKIEEDKWKEILSTFKGRMSSLTEDQIKTFEYTIRPHKIDESKFRCVKYLHDKSEDLWLLVYEEIYFLVFCCSVPILMLVLLNWKYRVVSMNHNERRSAVYV